MSEQKSGRLRRLGTSIRHAVRGYQLEEVATIILKAQAETEFRRSSQVQTYIQDVDKMVTQPYPYQILKSYSNAHPFLRIVHGALIKEVCRERWELREKFAKKCTGCGRMYDQIPQQPEEENIMPVTGQDGEQDSESLAVSQPKGMGGIKVAPGYTHVSEHVRHYPNYNLRERMLGKQASAEALVCPDCGGLLRDPDPLEKKRLQAFIDAPNQQDEWIDIVKSLLKDNLAVDDWYLSVYPLAGREVVVYNEDASEIIICADSHGRLGNDVYFCPVCWTMNKSDTYQQEGQTCKHCGGETVETAYVHKNNSGTITARYAENMIIHGNADPWLPSPYGNSKVMAIITELRSASAMGNYQFGLFSSGHMSKIIGLIGSDQKAANDIAQQTKDQTDRVEVDRWTGRVGRKLRNLFLGAPQGITVADAMPDSAKMQSTEWYDIWFVKVTGAIYGVQPVMMNTNVRGGGGYYQKMQINVNNDTTKEIQGMVEDAVNGQLLKFMGIRDWLWRFKEIEPVNEMEQAQIMGAKVKAGAEASAAGLMAELTEEGELKISGRFDASAPKPNAVLLNPDGSPMGGEQGQMGGGRQGGFTGEMQPFESTEQDPFTMNKNGVTYIIKRIEDADATRNSGDNRGAGESPGNDSK